MNQAPAHLPAEFLSQTLSLGQLIAIVRAYFKAIVLGALLTMVLAVAVSKLWLSKVYVATATVLADYEVNAPDTNREFPSNLAASYMATQVEFIGSALVLGKVLDALNLASDASMTKGYAGPASGLRQHLISKVLGGNLSISNPKDSRLIYVTYQAKSPEMAAKVANAVASTYLSEIRERVQAPAKARAEQYLQSVAELKDKLTAAETAVAEFRKRTGLIDLETRGDADSRRLEDLNAALLQAEVDYRDASARAQQVARLGEGGDADVEFTSSPGVTQIKQDLLVAERRLLELSKVLGPRHPNYIAAEAEVRNLRAKLSQELSGFGSGVVANARTRAGVSSSMVQSLKQRMRQEREQLLATREQQDESGRLLRELEAAEKLYNLALDNYGQIVRTAESQYSNISLLAEAIPPARHSKPKTTVNMLLGLVGGGVLSTLLCLLWELTHRRIRSAADFEQLLGEAPLSDLGARA